MAARTPGLIEYLIREQIWACLDQLRHAARGGIARLHQQDVVVA
mgnify:CR=1 FL=1